MLFVKVHNPISESDFLINVEQITSIYVDDCIIWLSDGGGQLTLDDVSINKVLNILRTKGVINDD